MHPWGWLQDIASLAFDEAKKQQKRSTSRYGVYPCRYLSVFHIKFDYRSAVATQSLGQIISRFIADFLFSIVMEVLFLFQVRDGTCSTPN